MVMKTINEIGNSVRAIVSRLHLPHFLWPRFLSDFSHSLESAIAVVKAAQIDTTHPPNQMSMALM